MSAFDELTLAELDEIRETCLGGKAINDDSVDPLSLAGAVMWATQRHDDPGLTWDAFRQKTRMGDIKNFSESMAAEAEGADATNPT